MTPHHATIDIRAPRARVFARLLQSDAIALLFGATDARETTIAPDGSPKGRAWKLTFPEREETIEVTHAIAPDSVIFRGERTRFLVLTFEAAPHGHTHVTTAHVDSNGQPLDPLTMDEPTLRARLAEPTGSLAKRIRHLFRADTH